MTNKKQIMEAIPSEQVDNALAMIKVLRRAMEMYPNEKELQAKLKDRISKLEKAITKGRDGALGPPPKDYDTRGQKKSPPGSVGPGNTPEPLGDPLKRGAPPTGPGGDEALPRTSPDKVQQPDDETGMAYPQMSGPDDETDGADDGDKKAQDDSKLSDINHAAIAQDLARAMDGFGTDEEAVLNAIKKLKNQADWNEVTDIYAAKHLSKKQANKVQPLWKRISGEISVFGNSKAWRKAITKHLKAQDIDYLGQRVESTNNKENAMNEDCGGMGDDGKVTISGSVDDLIRMMQLAGASGAKEVDIDDITPHSQSGPAPSMGDMIHMMSTEQDEEDYDGHFPDASTEPDEKYMNDVSASIPAGNDMHKSKKSYKATSGGDNPMNTEASIKQKLYKALAEKDTHKTKDGRTARKGLYYYVNKAKKAGTSRDKDHPDAPSKQDWKDAAKTAKK
tara:strand:- start:935 stop:2281 length:1347 start_codon:yes stop_codon:yes gene_type:complete